ncbi:unnamed protein product [Didymodactylos carnosus]|uniref:Ig-like domain-containing protein n=1 Tax=Didymodactylos carnosus TaxID=1234261 RepID=A0A8S2HBT6_9BILA|nr:unnamed protein product [Didymodactylos carnosus]CAF3603058.1 unnamed protein product [Didymodactylos carnosus]
MNDKPIPPTKGQVLSIGKTRRLVLKDCQLNENDAGITCELDQATKSAAKVFVKEEPFDFTDKLKNVKVKRGDKLELQCLVNKPNVKLEWLKDGKPLDIKEPVKYVVDGLVHKLIIPKSEDKDKGVYTARFAEQQTEGHVEVLGPPQIIKPPTDAMLPVTQSVTLTAEIIGLPKPTVTWFYKGNAIKSNQKYQADAKKDVYTLTIQKGDMNDQGAYTVVAENAVDKVQATANVTVCVKPKIDKLADVAVNIGESARLVCQFSGTPLPTLTWYKDGQPLKTGDRYTITEESNNVSVLTVRDTVMEDKAVYSVKAVSKAGEAEGKATLTIKPIKPAITKDLETTYVGTKGEDLILSVTGTGNPHPECKWFKNNNEMSTGDGRILFKEDRKTGEYSLIIKNATQEDIAEYQCQLSNVAGLIKSKKSKVTIQKAPQFIKKPQPVTVNQTEQAKIECQIDSFPIAKVTWLQGGKPLSAKDGFETSFDSKTGIATLIAKNVTTKHAGPFTVRAENTAGTAEEATSINVRSAPVVAKPLTDIEVMSTQDATFTCEFTASPTANVKWFKDGKPIVPSPTKHLVSFDEKTNSHKLVIKNSSPQDEGIYSAQATNDLGQVETKAKLNVNVPPEFINGLQDKTAIAKENTELTIKVSGTPQPTLTWLKHGKEIKPDDKKYSFIPLDKDGNAKLIIKDVQEDDHGQYSCVAKNKAGTSQSDCNLKVTAPLKFIKLLQDTDVLTTQNATFTCEVQGIPKANIKWYFNDIELKSTQKQTIGSTGNVHTLTVTRADQTDAGIYKAVADNGTGKPVETQANLVVGSKPKVEGKPADQTVNVEQPAVLECTFSGFPKPDVTWFKDNVPLTSTPDKRIEVREDKPNVHSLHINRSQLDDKSTYTCKAKNRFGETEAKINLNVNCIKPTIVQDLNEQQTVDKNKPLVLQAQITGIPTPTVKWFKGNDEILPTNKDYQITFDNKQTYTLTVPSCQPEHQAEYSCQATNPGGQVKSKKSKVTVQKAPEFIKKPTNQTVKEGQPVVFDAQVDAYPQPKVTWLRGGKPLTPDLGFESQFDAKTGQITLKHKANTTKQAGELVCRVENAAGTVDAQVSLDVQALPVITKKLVDQEVMVNNEIRFVAEVTGSPQPKIVWTKDDQPVKPDATHIIQTEGNSQILIIKDAKLNDEGKYKILAENPLGRVESQAALAVLEEPVIDKPFGDVIAPVGTDVHLTCKLIGGQPKAQLTWLKNGKEFKGDDRHIITMPDDKNGGKCELVIKNVDETDNQSKYTLVAKNKCGKKEINSNVTVKAPLEFTQPLKDQDVLSQSNMILQVETNGIPKPTVKWYFNDQELKNTPKSKVESKGNTHTLTLNKIDLPDDGIYKAVATNPDGTVETKAHVSVCTKPKVEGKVTDVTTTIGEGAELKTKFSAIPKPQVTWYKEKDNTPIKPNANIDIVELDDGTSILKFKTTDLVDTGAYIAKAVNKVGEVESKISLTVKEIKPTILNDLTNITANRDEPATFTLKATGNPKPQLKWFKNDEEILPTNKDYEIIADAKTDTYSLKVKQCKPEHQADYSAVLTNSGATIKSKKAKLTVQKTPEFLEKPTSVNVTENELAEFRCKVDSYPSAKITWLFDGKPISPKDGFEVQTDQATGTSVLAIKNAQPKHMGKITVKAENPTGAIEETIQCSVKTAPKITKKPTDTEALLHTDAVFTIDVTGSPKPQVEWFHGDKPIKASPKYEILEDGPSTHKLIIHDVTPADELPVKIKVKNALGETDANVNLKVLETPRIEPQLTDQEVVLHQTLTLKSNVFGRPKVDVQWLKNNQPLQPNDRIKITRTPQDECQLIITDVKEEDLGAYTLSVKNKVAKTDSTANIKITALNDLDVVQGSNGVLTVDCDGIPKPKLTWYFNDQEIKSNPKTRVDTKGTTSTLTINKADFPDIGTYKVVADNGKERIETKANVDVCVKPKLDSKPADVTCLIDETAKLSAKFSAVPAPVVTWHKNDGTQIVPNDRIQITTDENGLSTLIIKKSTTGDSGPYTAKATNKVGSVEAKINLAVKEVKPTLKNDLEPQTINVGDELVYRLAVDGRPAPTVKFFKDGVEVGPVLMEERDNQLTAVFRVPKAQITDQGEYQASVENPAGVVKTKKAKVTVQQIPVFLKAPDNQSVSTGKEATFEAKLSGFPVPKVTWLLNGKPVQPNADFAVNFDSNTQTATFTIKKTDADKHAGVVTCQVENAAGKITHDVKLDVKLAPQVTKQLKDESVIMGQDTVLTVESSGNPTPKPQWYFNDKPIPTNDQHYQMVQKDNVFELKIKGAKLTDEGKFKVVLTNSEGTTTSEAKLNVHVPPVIDSLPPKIEAVAGNEVVIACKVSGYPRPEITFLKDKKDVTTLDDKQRYRIEHDGDKVRLIISDVKEEDQGKYTVRAKNPASTTEEQTSLVVTAPLQFLDKLKDTDIVSGQNLTLTCRCQGIPKPTIQWFQNDIEIKSSTKQKIESKPDGTQTLTVNRVDLTDGGQFKVVATNKDGTTSTSCLVDVVMKPKIESKPQDTNVVIDEQAILSVKLSGVPKPKVEWLKNGVPVNVDNKRIQAIEKDDQYSLVINNAVLDDKAAYTLKATNKAGEIESPKLNLNVTAILPKVKTDLLPTLNVTKGEPLVLTLQADGKPKPTVKWFKGTEEIVPNKDNGIECVEEGDNTYKLIVKKAAEKDIGEYSAVIQNPGGQVKSKKTNVTVTKSPEFVTKPTDTTVKQGETATVSCQVDALPLAKVTLLKDGKPLTPKDGIEQTFDQATQQLVFTVKNARVDQAGQFTLKLDNSAGATETAFKLNVTCAPNITKPLTDQECLLGKDVKLTVNAASSPLPTIKWFKNNVELKDDQKHVKLVKVNDETYELNLLNATVDDEATYKCVVSNSLGEKETQAKLTVVEPTDLVCDFKDQTIQVGKPIKLECHVNGRPQPEVTWTKDGKELKPSDRIEITKKPDGTCTLLIPNAIPEDKGTYKVICKNKLQTKEAQAQLNVTSPLKFNTPLKDTVAQAGNSVTLEVECEGNTYKLTIPKADINDTGVYEVVIDNGIETINGKAKLDVCVKPKVEGKPADVNCNIGEPAKLQCKISGTPAPKVTWLKDGVPLQPSANVTPVEENDTYSLVFKTTELTDKASYTCVATNIGGTTEVKMNLNVNLIKPTLKTDLLKDIVTTSSEPIRLTVKASGTKPKVQWYKDGEEITTTVEEEYEVIEEEETYTLLIKRPQPKDSGEYQAVISNQAGQLKSKKIKVTVQTPAELKKKPQPVVTVKEGETAMFECEFDGHPTPKVTWIKDGKPVSPKDGYEVKTDTTTGKSQIIIPNAHTKHSGPLTVRLENPAGPAVEETVQLNVQTAPQLLQKPNATCEAHLNQDAIISFKCLGTPKPTVHLFKNEVEINVAQNTAHYEIAQTTTDTYEIRIKNVRPDDEGQYKIRMQNSLGQVDSNVVVTTVDEPRIKPSKTSIKTDLRVHDTLIMEYVVDGRPRPECVWMKDGKEVKPNAKTQITYDEKTNICRLMVTDVTEVDQGTYNLVAKNKLGKVETEPVKINVTAPLVLKSKLPDTLDGVVGENITLTVECDGVPQPKVQWFFKGEPLKSSPKHKIETKDGNKVNTLTISKLDVSDIGQYSVVLDNGIEKVTSQSTLNVHTKPKLESKLEPNMTFNVGETATIQMKVSGENNHVSWYKDSIEIKVNQRLHIVEENGLYTLTIDNLKPEDKGNYTLKVQNKGGNLECNTNVNVKEVKPQLLADLNDSPAANSAKVGEEFFLEIKAGGKPRPQVQWLFNGQEIHTSMTERIEIIETEETYRLVFRSFDARFAGEYQAIIQNGGGIIKTKKIRVTAQQAPQFTQALPQFITVKTGEKLTIEVRATGHPTPKVSWLRDGKALSMKDGYEIKVDQTTGFSSLIISNSTMKHSGVYECKIENQYGTHTATITIDVLPPTITQQKLQDFEISRGQEVTITVTANGSPLPSCVWYHNDQLLHPKKDRVVMIDDGPIHVLKILNAELSDNGVYKAVVESQMGKTELISNVTVMDVSDISSKPVDINVQQGGSCTMECTANGTPLPPVVWTKDGIEIKLSDRLILENNGNGLHRLLLKNAQADDAGKYVATVKHKIRQQQMIFNVTILNREQQLIQIQTQLRPLFLQFGHQDIPHSLYELLFNTANDARFQTPQDQLIERQRLLTNLANYLFNNSQQQLGGGKQPSRFNWPDVIKIIYQIRFPQIASTKIEEYNDGYFVQLTDVIRYSK